MDKEKREKEEAEWSPEQRKKDNEEFERLNKVAVSKLSTEEFQRKEFLREKNKEAFRRQSILKKKAWEEEQENLMKEQELLKIQKMPEEYEKQISVFNDDKEYKKSLKDIKKQIEWEKKRIISEMRYKNYLILLDCLVFNTWKWHTEEYFKKIKSSAWFAEEYNFQTPEISWMEIDFSGLEIMQDMTWWDAGFKINR